MSHLRTIPGVSWTVTRRTEQEMLDLYMELAVDPFQYVGTPCHVAKPTA